MKKIKEGKSLGTNQSYKFLLSERERQIKSTNDENVESDIIWYILEENHEDNEIKLEIKKFMNMLTFLLEVKSNVLRCSAVFDIRYVA